MKILPCPFCGYNNCVTGIKHDALRDEQNNPKNGYFVHCPNCLTATNHLVENIMPETEQEAIEMWNRRKK